LIRFVDETGSTNADLAARLGGGEFVPEGEWLVARRQTEGRGRRGREWFDGAGNFMGSTVVHKRFGDPDTGTLSLLAGLAAYEALMWHLPGDCDLFLKWPNDLMVGQAKLAGILLEGARDSVVVGIGVNLVFAPDLPDRKTISVSDIGTAPDLAIFAEDLAKAFDQELERWRSVGTGPLIRRWVAAAHPEGTKLLVVDGDEPGLTGTFQGLDEKGGLRLGLADGSMRVIQAGEVLLNQDSQ